jgi:hypothetical protein
MTGLRSHTLMVKRRSQGSYDQENDIGFFKSEGEEESFEILASVQPLLGSEIRLLPENRREEELLKIYTDSELFSSEKGSARSCDIVVINNKDYEVVKIFSWKNNIINHNKYILSKRTTNNDKL